MSNILIKKTGTGFEVSNGIITLQGPNRGQLLAIMDSLESQPAAAEKIQENVNKAAEVVKEKKNPESTKIVDTKKEQVSEKKKSGVQKVRDFMDKSKGPVTAKDVAEATGLSQKYCLNYLWNLWQKEEIKSEEKGIYFK